MGTSNCDLIQKELDAMLHSRLKQFLDHTAAMGSKDIKQESLSIRDRFDTEMNHKQEVSENDPSIHLRLLDSCKLARALRDQDISYIASSTTADSFICYLLGISRINPISFGLPAKAFWNSPKPHIYFRIPHYQYSQAIDLLNDTVKDTDNCKVYTYRNDDQDIVGEYEINGITVQRGNCYDTGREEGSVQKTGGVQTAGTDELIDTGSQGSRDVCEVCRKKDSKDTRIMGTKSPVGTNDTGKEGCVQNRQTIFQFSKVAPMELDSYIRSHPESEFNLAANTELQQIYGQNNTMNYTDMTFSELLALYGLAHSTYDQAGIRFAKQMTLAELPVYREDVYNLLSQKPRLLYEGYEEMGSCGFLRSPLLLWISNLQYLIPKAQVLEQLYQEWEFSRKN